MRITPIRTGKIIAGAQDIYAVLDSHIPPLKDGDVVVVTSKIVSICEGRIVAMDASDKKNLIEKEADLILDSKKAQYNITLTIKNNVLIPTAGIDESNGNEYYVLWPQDAQKSANEIRTYLKKRFSVKDVGVIITDSKTTPLRRGTTGVAIAHSGFKALKDYRGKEDIFGRVLKVTTANIADALAAAAVVVMGEGNEQTPLAIIDEAPFVEFQKKNSSKAEIKELSIKIKDDLYAPLIKAATWRRGR